MPKKISTTIMAVLLCGAAVAWPGAPSQAQRAPAQNQTGQEQPARQQPRAQQKGYANGRQMPVQGGFVMFVQPVGVHQRERLRQLACAFVMVHHDNVDARGFGHG